MSTRPRVALWGAGVMAGAHAGAAQALGWEIVGVASRTRARADDAARRWGTRSATYEQLLSTPDVDVAIVSTPPDDHLGAARAWTDRGVPTLISTPLCATLADADVLVDIENAGGAPLLFGSNLSMAPVTQEMFRRVRTMGQPITITGRAVRSAPTWGEFRSGRWGGGVLLHPGVHHVTLCLLVARLGGLGPAAGVAAGLSAGTEGEADDHAEVTIHFSNSSTARSTLSWRPGQNVWDLQLSSATSVVRLDMDPQPTLEVDGDVVELQQPAAIAPEFAGLVDTGIVGQLGGFLSDVRAGRAPVMNMAFGRDVLEVVSAAYASAGTGGNVVPLPYDGPRTMTPHARWHGIS